MAVTKKQYERWKDFALRMVNIVRSARHRAPSRATVRENIEFFFECRMEPDEEWRRVVDWDHTKPDEHDRHPMCVGDHISDLGEEFIPNYWSLRTLMDYERAADQWLNPISNCVRAGLDVAVSPSAGVVGFTAGDIRKMYPNGVPKWIIDFIDQQEAVEVTGVVPGVGFTFNPTGKQAPAFSTMHDDDPIWL